MEVVLHVLRVIRRVSRHTYTNQIVLTHVRLELPMLEMFAKSVNRLVQHVKDKQLIVSLAIIRKEEEYFIKTIVMMSVLLVSQLIMKLWNV